MNQPLKWKKQPFTVGLTRILPGGTRENYTDTVTGMVLQGTGLGYWKSHKGTPDEELFGTFLITHLASGLRICSETKTDDETRAFIERMCQPFVWDDETTSINWNLSSEELQALPCWPDIQMVRRENWMQYPIEQVAS